MDILKTFVTIFLVVILTISFSNNNILAKSVDQQIYRCIDHCPQFYGNRKCYMDCRKKNYDGGQCDYIIKGPTTPLCCCYNYTIPLSPN
ncbi:hypothetical protein CARUB_v10015566mg [Capsella rubella]|uniref:Defensin-like domain-containing protein n=1 Tax=Capsella rubella TaxID=81985 RepID=R0HR89_9BRAS|nr:hypothetical protein CARUB_v10015566mg [Capsella rubella]